MIYLVVGIDHGSLAPWHENISAGDVARAARTAVVVAAVIGPNSTVHAHAISELTARRHAA